MHVYSVYKYKYSVTAELYKFYYYYYYNHNRNNYNLYIWRDSKVIQYTTETPPCWRYTYVTAVPRPQLRVLANCCA